MARLNKFAAATALAAAFSLAATPAMARGHDHHWHRWHRDRVDGGDVLAGALILGGIAAIASAASKKDRQDREAPPPPVPEDRRGYTDRAGESDVGLDRAADMCAQAVDSERSRVDYVDNVNRDRDGWSVSGALIGGAPFSCRIGNDGQVSGVNVGDQGAGAAPAAGDGPGTFIPPVDNRPEWHDQGSAQPAPQAEPQDDGRYDASDAPDFGQSA
jgi:hypothetical protein